MQKIKFERKQWFAALVSVVLLLFAFGLFFWADWNEHRITYFDTVGYDLLEQYQESPEEMRGDSTEELPEGTYYTGYRSTPNFVGEIDCEVAIPSIDLDQVVITGDDSDYNLNRYLLVTGSSAMHYGSGNYVICGHDSRNYGHCFNRLHEVKEGDCITITKGDVTDTYYVYSVALREKSESADITRATDGKELTLLTCEKTYKKEPRYVVIKAKIED